MTNDPQTEFLALGAELRTPCTPERRGEIERQRASIFARLSMGERQALLHAERQAADAEFRATGQVRPMDAPAIPRVVSAVEAENARLRQENEKLKAQVEERRHWTRTPDDQDHEDHPMENMLPSKPTVEPTEKPCPTTTPS